MTKTGFIGSRPSLIVQQMGELVLSQDDLYRGCIQLRAFVPGCDYYDRERADLVGCIARRKVDDRIFAAPDFRFMEHVEFDVIWFKERRLRQR
jgi:hypothetical protein